MDFRQIEAFVYVVKLQSFSRAAEAIFLTQPTISSHIHSLENELGIKLIDRSGKDVIPTAAGKLFYGYCTNIINTRDHAIYKLNEFQHKATGKIEIGSSTIPAQYIIPEYIATFSAEHEDVNFSIEQLDSKLVIDHILSKNIELGFVGTITENEKLDFFKISSDKLVLIVPNTKKFEKYKDEISITDVINENFIIREVGSGTRMEFERAIKAAGHNPKQLKIIAQMSSVEAIKQSVSIGLGISIVSQISVEDYDRFGLVKVLNIKEIEMTRAFYLVTHKNRPISPLVSLFINFIISNHM